MSNVKERGRLGDILMREFAPYADALTVAGLDWSVAWNDKSVTATFVQGGELYWRRRMFLLARECAGMANHRFTDEQLTQMCRDHLKHRELFPELHELVYPPEGAKP
ncbi:MULTISPECIES: hypothetical protein [unclassified Streptomyces]|uniref:hypothetical protein n=1 Tax=unclassified Streptomyces TaxID=2593676 RepID=UPI0033214277